MNVKVDLHDLVLNATHEELNDLLSSVQRRLDAVNSVGELTTEEKALARERSTKLEAVQLVHKRMGNGLAACKWAVEVEYNNYQALNRL